MLPISSASPSSREAGVEVPESEAGVAGRGVRAPVRSPGAGVGPTITQSSPEGLGLLGVGGVERTLGEASSEEAASFSPPQMYEEMEENILLYF